MERSSIIVPATPEDLKAPALRDRHSGLFHDVDDDTIAQIADCAYVRRFAAGEVVFRQGDPTANLPLFVILDGLYSVVHLTEDGALRVAEEGAGVLLGDVEMLLAGDRSRGPADADRVDRGRTRATVACEQAGCALWIFPPSVIWETRSFVLAQNLARLMAIKIVQRYAYLEPEVLGRPRHRIARCLKQLIEAYGTEPAGTPGWLRLRTDITQADVARRLHLKQQNVSSLYTRNWQRRGLLWEGREVRMTEAFHALLLHHTERLIGRATGDAGDAGDA